MGDPLLGYAWNGDAEIPSVYATDTVRIDYGEPPLTEDTALYLSFNEGAGDEIRDVSPDGRTVEVEGIRWVPGRFGAAVAASAEGESALRVLGDAPLLDGAFTLDLWVRPETLATGKRAARQVLASQDGLLELAVDAEGRVAIELRAGDETVRLRSPAPLRAQAWSHVALAVDPMRFHNLRLVVNGEPRWAALPARTAVPEGRPGPVLRGPLALGGWGDPERAFDGAIDQVALVRRALPTSTLIERSRVSTPRGEHLLALRFESGLREERLWAFPLRHPTLVSESDWQSGDLQQVIADAQGLRWVPGRWERVRTQVAPAPRTTHPTLFVGGHRAFVFGGEVRDSHAPPMINTNDTWLYDVERRRWSLVEPPRSPSPRCHQALAYSPDHDMVLLVGGWQNASPGKPLLQDVWVYHVSERRWEERPARGARIHRQSDSGVVYHAGAKRFLLFRREEIYEYDPVADLWSERPAALVVNEWERPDQLSGRVSPIMGYDPESGLVLRFGGARLVDGERIYTDTTALYDYDRNRWTVLRPNPAPSPRVRGALAYDSVRGRFILFGGVRDQNSRRYGDLWAFDVGARGWSRIEASNPPSPRGGHYGMAFDPELDVFVLTAGRVSHPVILDETWHLTLDPEGEGTATYVFDRTGFPEADRWSATSSEPAGSAVTFRFSGSDDGSTWGPWVAEPALLAPGSPRYVKVEAALSPGEGGLAPRVESMGFHEADRAGDGRTRELPIAPLALGASH